MHNSGRFFLCLLLVFFSCVGEPKYLSLIEKIPAEGWNRQIPFTFEIPIPDSLSLYHIDIIGRVRNIYVPDSLTLVLRVNAPSGASFTDTLSLGLTHTYDRIWEDFRFSYCSHVRFTQKGIWRFELWHQMDSEILKGVFAIGLYAKKERNGKK